MNFPLPLGLLFALSQALDGLSTWFSLRRGSTEFNPLLGGSIDRIWLLKGLATITGLIIIYLIWQRKPSRFAIWAVCFISALTILAAIWNTLQ